MIGETIQMVENRQRSTPLVTVRVVTRAFRTGACRGHRLTTFAFAATLTLARVEKSVDCVNTSTIKDDQLALPLLNGNCSFRNSRFRNLLSVGPQQDEPFCIALNASAASFIACTSRSPFGNAADGGSFCGGFLGAELDPAQSH
jgi:hypothetical protein